MCGANAVGMMNTHHFQELAGKLPRGSIAVAPDAGHLLVMERPKWCALHIGMACELHLPQLFKGLSASSEAGGGGGVTLLGGGGPEGPAAGCRKPSISKL
jgi:hypothetical protein